MPWSKRHHNTLTTRVSTPERQINQINRTQADRNTQIVKYTTNEVNYIAPMILYIALRLQLNDQGNQAVK